MDEGIKGKMDEGKKKSTPEVIEKVVGKSKISPEIDPRGSQIELRRRFELKKAKSQKLQDVSYESQGLPKQVQKGSEIGFLSHLRCKSPRKAS